MTKPAGEVRPLHDKSLEVARCALRLSTGDNGKALALLTITTAQLAKMLGVDRAHVHAVIDRIWDET